MCLILMHLTKIDDSHAALKVNMPSRRKEVYIKVVYFFVFVNTNKMTNLIEISLMLGSIWNLQYDIYWG